MAVHRKTMTLAGVAALAIGAGGVTFADIGENRSLIVNGEIEMIVEAPAPGHIEGLDTIYSGWVFRSPETQMMQADDFDNPAMLDVDAARETFDTVMGTEGQSCASCHDTPESLAGVRAT